jgi:hypothetical protein
MEAAEIASTPRSPSAKRRSTQAFSSQLDLSWNRNNQMPIPNSLNRTMCDAASCRKVEAR